MSSSYGVNFMALELVKKIFNKTPSTPLASWIFRVHFYYTTGSGVNNEFDYILNNENDISSIPIKADLPKFETHFVTQKYFRK